MDRNDDFLNPHEQPEYKCSVCEQPLYEDRMFCSDDCWKASLI
jgi:predicted nucleic acid-binding Zn ribbon protein